MNTSHYFEMLRGVESASNDAVRSCHPRSWNEDHITYTLLQELVRTTSRGLRIEGLDRPFSVRFDAFKARGHLEQATGDIAVVVQRRAWDGDTLVGIGYAEAKRRYDATNEFSALDFSQLARLHDNAPHLQVLLYDYDHATGFVQDGWLAHSSDYYSDRRYGVVPFTHAVAVPASVVRALGKSNTSLYKYGVPWSHQLCGRYLAGFDLDFSAKALSAVSNFAATVGGFRYVIVAEVDAQGTFSDWDPFARRVNSDRFERIDRAV